MVEIEQGALTRKETNKINNNVSPSTHKGYTIKNFINSFVNQKKYFTKLHTLCYNYSYKFLILIMTPEAERFNGWAAMLGFVAAVGAYVTTGQIIPGWF